MVVSLDDRIDGVCVLVKSIKRKLIADKKINPQTAAQGDGEAEDIDEG